MKVKMYILVVFVFFFVCCESMADHAAAAADNQLIAERNRLNKTGGTLVVLLYILLGFLLLACISLSTMVLLGYKPAVVLGAIGIFELVVTMAAFFVAMALVRALRGLIRILRENERVVVQQPAAAAAVVITVV